MVEDKFRGFARVAARDGEEPPDGGLYILDLGRFIDENPLAIVPRPGMEPRSGAAAPELNSPPPVQFAGQTESRPSEPRPEPLPSSPDGRAVLSAEKIGPAVPDVLDPSRSTLDDMGELSGASATPPQPVSLFDRILSGKREDHNAIAREINRHYGQDLAARFMLQGALSDVLETDDPEERREILAPYEDLKRPKSFNIIPLLGLIFGRVRIRPGGRGKKATDHGKNEPHGDAGRALMKAEKQVEALKSRLNQATSRREKKELLKKIQRVWKDALAKSKGESHGGRSKR